MDRQTICEHALALFNERGYENVTVQDICRACGITKPTFYRYVSAKEDLVLDVYDDISRRLAEQLLDIIDASNHWQQLVICFDTLIAESEKLGPELLSQALISNLQDDRHSFDLRPRLMDVAVRIIHNGQAAGQIGNQAPAEELFRTAAYLFQGHELMWCIRGGNEPWRDELIHELSILFQVSTTH